MSNHFNLDGFALAVLRRAAENHKFNVHCDYSGSQNKVELIIRSLPLPVL